MLYKTILDEDKVFHKQEHKLLARVQHVTLPLNRLPTQIKVNVKTVAHIEWSSALISYVAHRVPEGASFILIANELNRFYNTNIFTRSSVARIVMNNKIKRRVKQ